MEEKILELAAQIMEEDSVTQEEALQSIIDTAAGLLEPAEEEETEEVLIEEDADAKMLLGLTAIVAKTTRNKVKYPH